MALQPLSVKILPVSLMGLAFSDVSIVGYSVLRMKLSPFGAWTHDGHVVKLYELMTVPRDRPTFIII